MGRGDLGAVVLISCAAVSCAIHGAGCGSAPPVAVTPRAPAEVADAPGSGQPFDGAGLFRRAKRDIAAGRHGRAERDLLYLFDHGLSLDESFAGVIISSVPSMLAELGAAHPSARRQLRTRKERLESALRGGEALPVDRVLLYATSARALGAATDGVETCRSLPHTPAFERQREVLCIEFLPELVDAGAHEEAISVKPSFLRALASHAQHQGAHPDKEATRTQISHAARLLESSLRKEGPEDAIAFATLVLESLPWAEACLALMTAASAAGQPQVAIRIRERALHKLPLTEVEKLDELGRSISKIPPSADMQDTAVQRSPR